MHKFSVAFILFLFAYVAANATIFFPSLASGFRSLNEYDYFRARKIFMHYRHSKPYASELGLADIYSRFDNPFSKTDSAFACYTRLHKLHDLLDASEKDRLYKKFALSDTVYRRIILRIDSIGFSIAQKQNTIAAYQHFIFFFKEASQQKEAYRNIEKISFNDACIDDSPKAYLSFIQKFQDAPEKNKAMQRLDAALFKECLQSKDIQQLAEFPKKYPQSVFVPAAQDSLYAILVGTPTEKSLLTFIKNYPENKNINQAWFELYQLGNDNSPGFYKKFIQKYPDYPFIKNVANELLLAEKTFLPVQVNGKWGFVDETGSLMIPARFESVDVFSESLCAVQEHNKFGYVNKSGLLSIPAVYDDAEQFRQGLALVKKNETYFFINRQGKSIPGEWEDASDFSEALAAVKKQGKYGYTDASGQLIIPLKFKNAGDFTNGLALVESDSGTGVINRKGEYVIMPAYEWLDDFRNARARFMENESYGLISASGEVLIPAQFDMLEFINDSTMIAAKGEKCGIVFCRKNQTAQLMYDFNGSVPLHSGAGIFFQLKNKSGLVSREGKIIIPFEYSGLKPVGEGLLAFRKKLKWGLMDSTRKVLIKPSLDGIGKGNAGLFAACQKKLWGLMNKEGKWVVPAMYHSLELSDFGWIVTKKNQKGMLAFDGSSMLETEYQEITPFDEQILKLIRNNLQSYYLLKKRQIIFLTEGQ
jgi:hypothetical protein